MYTIGWECCFVRHCWFWHFHRIKVNKKLNTRSRRKMINLQMHSFHLIQIWRTFFLSFVFIALLYDDFVVNRMNEWKKDSIIDFMLKLLLYKAWFHFFFLFVNRPLLNIIYTCSVVYAIIDFFFIRKHTFCDLYTRIAYS